MASLPLLLEIGVEELPSSFVDAALAALPKIVGDELAKARLTHGTVRPLGTPRRLAVSVQDVADRQMDLDEQVVGPPESAAFKDGKPTRAAEAFAGKLGIPVESLEVVEMAAAQKQKSGRYVVGRRVEKGRPALDLLGSVLASVCAGIPFRKSMRWGDLDATFGRPVQWLVALLGPELVSVHFAGITSGRASYGHRFLAPAKFDVKGPETYVADLRTRHVLVDHEERVRTMMDRVTDGARALGGTHDSAQLLVDENASLVEEPHVVTGSFDQAFLALPAAVIRAVARGHQRYFCVQKGEDELLPHYLAVVNTANRPDLITKGTDGAMRGRLADALFFWQEDQKSPLDSRMEKLGGIVFHNKLGTVRQKVDRILRIADHIAQTLSLPPETRGAIRRAGVLCKCDLVTLMVGEFPELQGHMARAYAMRQGEPSSIADALRDHYRPVGAQDDVAPDDISATLALSDRLDTLAGCFAVGLSPTGAADPFALRRACIAALRTIIERGYAPLSFSGLIAFAYGGFEGKPMELSNSDTVAKVDDFATERLRGLVAVATSSAVADAVFASAGQNVLRNAVATVARARALQGVVDAREAWLEKAKVVAKRLAGISREAEPELHPMRSFEKSPKKDDRAIQNLVQDLHDKTQDLSNEKAVIAALMNMGLAATELDRIFIDTLVNDPEDAYTPMRLATLAYGARVMLRVADFSKL